MSDSIDYFGGTDAIFRNKDLLQVKYLPDEDRIIGRNEQLNNLGSSLRPAIKGQTPNHVLIYGKTGTGKSLCSKFMARQLQRRAAEDNVGVGIAYVDCFQDSTETQAIKSIAIQLNDDTTNIRIPASGLSTGDYYRKLWTVIDDYYDVVIVILDEIDKLDSDNVLMQLSRAVESGKLNDSTLGVIGISNKIQYKDTLNERVKSSLSEREFVFPPYDANQLRAILESRQDAFQEGALSDGVPPRVAALAAREHGDARKAIDILRFAGEIAEDEDATQVKQEHVDQAHEREEQNRVADLISKSTPHSRFVLIALANIVQQRGNAEAWVATNDVFDVYRTVCKGDGAEPLKKRRIRDILSELEFLSIIDQDLRGKGQGQGNYMVNRLAEVEPTTVIKACSNAS
ncbi:cell division control protein Cdc6 [Haloprofundus marisrubri]|uniref:ORC1-type DNA replication protein n=1 Tax=Haloprofundus marisrubri TaxID=1514971 RepID=A0A0W1RDF0_9EURY|nr:orc1/cdc6 family replication initiation protein [Haloprofundus marisrubri]KTG11453.1 cell division control protein Cdc6 [Haloprofundus marisrubri]